LYDELKTFANKLKDQHTPRLKESDYQGAIYEHFKVTKLDINHDTYKHPNVVYPLGLHKVERQPDIAISLRGNNVLFVIEIKATASFTSPKVNAVRNQLKEYLDNILKEGWFQTNSPHRHPSIVVGVYIHFSTRTGEVTLSDLMRAEKDDDLVTKMGGLQV
jgi:hypothetical protein